LDPALEQVLQDSMGGGDASPGFEPGLADRVQTALADSTRAQEARATRRAAGRAQNKAVDREADAPLDAVACVLAYNEIPENRRIRVIAAVGR